MTEEFALNILSFIPNDPTPDELAYYDPRLGMVAEALHLPNNLPHWLINRIRIAINTKEAQIISGTEKFDSNDIWAGYLHGLYLKQFGNNPASQAHLLSHAMRFTLMEYIDEFHVGEMKDPKATVAQIEQSYLQRYGYDMLKSMFEEHLFGIRFIIEHTEPHITLFGLEAFLNNADMENPRLMDEMKAKAFILLAQWVQEYENLMQINNQYTSSVLAIAARFPKGTQISIDYTCTPTCVLPDATTIQPVVGPRKNKTAFVINYALPGKEMESITFPLTWGFYPKFNEVRQYYSTFNPIIHHALNMLYLCLDYLWYLDRIEPAYSKSDPNVTVRLEDKSVAGGNYKEGNVYDLREFMYFLQGVYNLQAKDLEAVN